MCRANHDQKEAISGDGRTAYRAEGCTDIDGLTTSTPVAASTGEPLLLAGLGGCLRYNASGQHQYTQQACSTAPTAWRRACS